MMVVMLANLLLGLRIQGSFPVQLGNKHFNMITTIFVSFGIHCNWRWRRRLEIMRSLVCKGVLQGKFLCFAKCWVFLCQHICCVFVQVSQGNTFDYFHIICSSDIFKEKNMFILLTQEFQMHVSLVHITLRFTKGICINTFWLPMLLFSVLKCFSSLLIIIERFILIRTVCFIWQ